MISFLYVPFPADKDYVAWGWSLVSRKLAASINVLPATSFFFWEGELKKEDEVILVIKTSEEKAPELKKVVSQEHPYRVPAIIEIPVADVNSSYLRWVEEMTAR